METPTGPLPFATILRRREPDRRHQVAAAQLGQHPRIDLVRLAGERGEAFDPHRIGDIDAPSRHLQLVMNEASAVHRLDRRVHRLSVLLKATDEGTQPIAVGQHCPGVDGFATVGHGMDIHALPAEIESNVQHYPGASSAVSGPTTRRLSESEAPLHGIQMTERTWDRAREGN